MNAMTKKVLATVLVVALAACAAHAQGLPQQRSNMLGNRLMRPGAQQRGAAPAASAPLDPGEVTMSGETSVMNMDGAALELVLKIYGELVNKTIIVDPAVQGTLNNTIKFKSAPGQKLTNEERIFAYETILEMNQIHLEPFGESFIRALPRKDVRKEGIPLIMDPETQLGESSKVVSMMINFKNIAIDEAQKILEGLKSNSGVLLVFERTGSILVTDTEQNINRMLEIAKVVDVATPVTEVVEVRQIKYASATEILTAIQKIVEESQKELEKNGKRPQAQAAAVPPASRVPTLLRRPGQPNQPAASTPASNESIFMNVSDADRGMIRGKVVIVPDERSNKLIFVTSKSNMDFFDKVIEQLDVETTPDTVVKVYRLKYAECEDVSDMINDLIGNAPSSKGANKSNQNQNAKAGTSGNITRNTPSTTQKKSANQRTGEAKTGELSKENTTVLADKRINGIVVMTNKELVPVLEKIIESMDIKLSQVLIETCIIEVGLGHGLESGIDWVQKGRRHTSGTDVLTDSLGRPLYYPKVWDAENKKYTDYVDYSGTPVLEKTESASSVKALKNVSAVARDGLLNYYTGGAYGLGGGSLGDGSPGGAAALGVAQGVTSNLLSKSFSFVFDSDKLGLSTIIHMTENDSRSKYIASPIIMTLDNKEAVINATSMHYLLKGFTSSGNSYSTIAVPDYEQKELGIEIKTTPKINPNGTVMLTVEEKYTQLGANETIQYSSSNSSGGSGGLQSVQVPTTVTREMSSDILLENGQTVVFGGLTDTTTTESETGIPLLKDIPWIGRWLFGSTEQTEKRTELLVFMTPYVLDDAQAAQAEALRRKKTMSDSRPWEDHGWSLSELADPVSKKEQMRRIKEEAAKQDEERSARIAIEQWKLDRAKRLKEMSKEERDLWLKMHKEELEEEKQEELEKKMQDKESQEELRRLAAEVREQKLAEAGRALKKAADDTAAENERARLDAESAEKKDGESAEKKDGEGAEKKESEGAEKKDGE